MFIGGYTVWQHPSIHIKDLKSLVVLNSMFFRLETNCLSIDFQVKDGKLILWYKLSEFIIAIYSDYKRKNDLFFFTYMV